MPDNEFPPSAPAPRSTVLAQSTKDMCVFPSPPRSPQRFTVADFTGFLAGRKFQDHNFYVSSLKRVEASRYSRRHTSRLIITTITAIISVEASSRSKRPASLAALIVLPNPGA